MTKLTIALVMAGLMVLATAVPAFAAGPPCGNPAEGGSQAGHADDNGKANWFGKGSGKCS